MWYGSRNFDLSWPESTVPCWKTRTDSYKMSRTAARQLFSARESRACGGLSRSSPARGPRAEHGARPGKFAPTHPPSLISGPVRAGTREQRCSCALEAAPNVAREAFRDSIQGSNSSAVTAPIQLLLTYFALFRRLARRRARHFVSSMCVQSGRGRRRPARSRVACTLYGRKALRLGL